MRRPAGVGGLRAGGPAMRTRWIVWIALLVLAVLLTLAVRHYPYLPGDVAVTRAVQSALPVSTSWASGLSATADEPWVFILVAITFAVSWAIGGWRAAMLSLASYAGMWAVGRWLGPLIAQPRPSADLVRVAAPLSGSAFPSLFALRYAATFGYLATLAIKASGASLSAAGTSGDGPPTARMSSALRWTIIIICACLLFAGAAARLALGAHWPSDIALSYLIGFLWATLLLRAVR